MSGRRVPGLGRIHRLRPLPFTFDGVEYTGLEGDTLASALLANGVDVIGHGIYSGRPRGVMAAGVEDPNSTVQVRWPDGTRFIRRNVPARQFLVVRKGT